MRLPTINSDQPRDLVQHKGSSDRDVETVPAADHRDFDCDIDVPHTLGRDAVALIAEDDDRAAACRGQVGQSDRLMGQLDPDDVRSAFALSSQPPADVAVHPVDARAPTECVALAECVWHPWLVRDGKTGADGIAGAEQGAEVDAVLGPQRRGDQVIPAAMRSSPTLLAEFCSGPNIGRHGAAVGRHTEAGKAFPQRR